MLVSLSVPSIGMAVYESRFFGVLEFTSLALAALTVFITSFVKFEIPNTKVTIWAREFAIFFGAIWLGVPGAIFLGLIAVVITLIGENISFKKKIAIGSVNLFASLLATECFYLFLKLTIGFNEKFVGLNAINPYGLILGIIVLGIIYYVINSALTSVFLSKSTDQPLLTFWSNHLKFRFLNTLLGQFLSVSVYFALIQFGLFFGLLLLPTAAFVFYVFRFHNQVLAQKTAEIEESSRIHLATVEALAIAIDARDQLGEDHVRRVQILAVGLGEAMSLGKDDLNALRTGALLHDIGKLAIPDHILNKPSELTPAEMEKMKIHPSVGASILEKIDFKNPVVSTVRHHHEAWDGTGYPNKLKGEKIPLTARVLTIADAYDTLRGARPHRLPLSKIEARRILLDGAGIKFDPKMIDIFLRHLHIYEAEINIQGLSYSLDSPSENIEADRFESHTKSKHGYVEQIKSANKEVFTLYELAKVFTSSLNLTETLELFSLKVGELVPFDTCAVYIFNQTKGYAVAQYVDGENDELLEGRKVKLGEGATGYALSNKKPVNSINPILDFTSINSEELKKYVSMISLPLLVENRLIGAVSLYSCELESYEEEHMRLLETISKIAAEAISKALVHADTETKALTDPMTNLPNARSLQLQFDIEVARSRRNEKPFQVVMLDLDGFKNVNDSFGHKAGDLLLREISKVMRGQLRDYDFLSRYAGDEFVALIPETTDSEIQELVQRIEQAVFRFALPISEGKVARVGVSIGHASFPRHGEALDQVLIAADTAMYSIKALRKQRKNLQHQEDLRKSFKPIPNPDNRSVPISQPESMPHENMPIIVPDTAMIFELDESHIISDSIN